MKVLKELELRRSILLELREKISLESSFFVMDTLKQIDFLLSQIELKIIQVGHNKLFYFDNDEAFAGFNADMDEAIRNIESCFS